MIKLNMSESAIKHRATFGILSLAVLALAFFVDMTSWKAVSLWRDRRSLNRSEIAN